VTPRYDPVGQAKAAARMYASFGGRRALAEWGKVLVLAPDDAEALAATGELLLQEKQLDEAATYLERAVDRDPQSGRAWFHYGYALAQKQKFEEALRAFTLAEELLDDPYPARQNRIGMVQRLGRAAEAAALDAEADPDAADDPAEAWYNRGLGAVKAGKLDDSIVAVGKAIEQRPDHANSYYTLACAHCLRAQAGDDEKALACVAKALELDPELAADIAGDSDFERLKADPRFGKLVGR
jgi:tetratricopeptide (TPR) repeat protein